MKILTIITSHFGYDGISNVATNYYIYQDHSSLRIDFITINPVTNILEKSIKKNNDSLFVFPYRNTNPLKYVSNLIKIIRQGKYDIVHIHGNSSTMAIELLAAKLGGTKVRIVHSHNTTCNHKLINKILKPFFSKLYTTGFACGQEAGEWLFGEKFFYIISNGVDLEKYSYSSVIRNAMKMKYNLQNRFVVGHVGRFSLQKNHKKLVSIYNEIEKQKSNIELVLLGDGELSGEIKEYCKQKKLNVRFIGNSNEVAKWLQVFDIIVFPSLFEGLPLFLIEAQAAGVDCFISDTISPMTKITPLVHFIPLTYSDSDWAKNILTTNLSDRTTAKSSILKCIKEAHFDVRANCIQMKNLYAELFKEKICFEK